MRDNSAKAVLIFYGLIFLVCFISSLLESIDFESLNNPWDYAKITDVDYTARLVDEPGNSGKVIVTEKLTFDIHAASRSNLFWELWRDLCEDEVDGLKVDYKVLSVHQLFEGAPPLEFKESKKLYWDDFDYTSAATSYGYGPGKWYHSPGPYNEYMDRYECVFFYVDGLYREKPVYQLVYEMNNAALRYGDCSELYLSMFSEDSVNHLNSFKGKILIPNSDMPKEGNYYANTFGTNSNEFEFTESNTTSPGFHTFAFELDKEDLKFKPYNEYIEFNLVSFGDDKHKFTDYAPENDYSRDPVLEELKYEQSKYESQPLDSAKTKFIVLIICLICSFILIKRFLRADNEIESKYNIYTPSMDMDYFRDIPSNLDPMFAANLAFCRHPRKKDLQDGYAAVVLSLARKDYIELTKIDESKDWTDANTKVRIKDQPVILHPDLRFVQADINAFEADSIDDREPLTKTEELYLNLLKRHAISSQISMAQFQNKVAHDYENTDLFVKSIERSTVNIGVSQGYFQKADYREAEKKLKSKSLMHLIMGIILVIFVNLISYNSRLDLAYGGFTILGCTYLYGSFIYKYLSSKYLLLTQFGEDEYVKWKGLYNFLNSETLMNERTVVELPIWEQYLVYATAFGISNKVIRALKIRCPEADSSPVLSNSYYRSNHFYSSNRSFRHSVHRASHIHRSSSYSSGGSWRLRWWRPWRRRRWRWSLNHKL